VGHPSREQAYAGLPEAAGRVGEMDFAISSDSPDADIVFLGSSVLLAGLDMPTIERAMSAHLGRPAHVVRLGMNWQGLDLQYFLLRDYLRAHHAGLIVWNLPAPSSRSIDPHIEAYHWVRFDEYTDGLAGLPVRFRLALYGDMVLGAPRELLSDLRPNLLGGSETVFRNDDVKAGYYGASFVPESIDPAAIPTLEQTYEEPPYNLVRVTGKPLNAYGFHFAVKIAELAQERHIGLAFMHVPIDSEQGLDYMPERSRWSDTLHTNSPIIGVTSAELFKTVDKTRFYHFYTDQHFNMNGKTLFTQSMIPAILEAYDEKDRHQ
jgi:hypothetical protein